MKIIGIYGHMGFSRQLAATKHDWTFVLFDDRAKKEHGYRDLFTDKEKNNFNIIGTDEFWEKINNDYFDAVYLDKDWTIQRFCHLNMPKLYGWVNVRLPVPETIKAIGDTPFIPTTSNDWDIRPQDRIVSIGVDPNDFPKRDIDEVINEGYLFPVNCYLKVALRAEKEGEHYLRVVGYDWDDVISDPNLPIKKCGYNPIYDERFKTSTRVDRHVFKEWMRNYASLFQPSPMKHHSNIMAEALMTGQAIITRPMKQYRVNSSHLINNWNSIIISEMEDFRKLHRNGFLKDRKKLKQLGENAHQTAIDHFNIKRTTEKWEEFIEHSIAWQ